MVVVQKLNVTKKCSKVGMTMPECVHCYNEQQEYKRHTHTNKKTKHMLFEPNWNL